MEGEMRMLTDAGDVPAHASGLGDGAGDGTRGNGGDATSLRAVLSLLDVVDPA